MKLWLAVLVASGGCAALKLAGYVVPARLLESAVARRILEALPVTLLSALIAVSVFATGGHLVLDFASGGACGGADSGRSPRAIPGRRDRGLRNGGGGARPLIGARCGSA